MTTSPEMSSWNAFVASVDRSSFYQGLPARDCSVREGCSMVAREPARCFRRRSRRCCTCALAPFNPTWSRRSAPRAKTRGIRRLTLSRIRYYLYYRVSKERWRFSRSGTQVAVGSLGCEVRDAEPRGPPGAFEATRFVVSVISSARRPRTLRMSNQHRGNHEN